VFLANEESRAAFEREDALDTLLQLCRFTTNNQVLRVLRALLIQFTDDEDAWRRIVSDPQQEAVRIVLAAAESGVASAAPRDSTERGDARARRSVQSPLCEVVAGRGRTSRWR
jgi:hypothetical protein